MRHTRLWLALAGLVVWLSGARAEGQHWSPDGRWLAYTQAGFAPADGPDWLLGGDRGPDLRSTPTRFRLWATRVEDSGAPADSVLLTESSDPITQPAWNRDGTRLAFGHLVVESGRARRFEVVVQGRPRERRVLASWPVSDDPVSWESIGRVRPEWSPDGRHLVAPRVSPPGLAVLRVADGRRVRELPEGARPSWSPKGDRLAFATGGPSPGLDMLDLATDTVRRLADGPAQERLPPVVWSRDGQSVIRVAYQPGVAVPPREIRQSVRGPGQSAPPPMASQLRLERLSIRGEGREVVMELVHETFQTLDDLIRLELVDDREGEAFYYTSAAVGETSSFNWIIPRNAEVHKRTNPFSGTTPLGPLATWPSPTARMVALRMGPDDRLSPPALLVLDPERLRLLAPDDDARMVWISLILGAVDEVLAGSLAMPPELGGPSLRPTPLPSPGELDPDDSPAGDLRRLAALGQPLCGPPTDSESPDPSAVAYFEEARLVFAYLRGDFAEALAALPASAETPDGRLRLLGLRAQILMGLKRFEEAAAILGYLRETTGREVRPLEDGPLGPVLGPPEVIGGWPEVLADRLNDLRRAPLTDDDTLTPDLLRAEEPIPGLGPEIPLPNILPPPAADVAPPRIPVMPIRPVQPGPPPF